MGIVSAAFRVPSVIENRRPAINRRGLRFPWSKSRASPGPVLARPPFAVCPGPTSGRSKARRQRLLRDALGGRPVHLPLHGPLTVPSSRGRGPLPRRWAIPTGRPAPRSSRDSDVRGHQRGCRRADRPVARRHYPSRAKRGRGAAAGARSGPPDSQATGVASRRGPSGSDWPGRNRGAARRPCRRPRRKRHAAPQIPGR